MVGHTNKQYLYIQFVTNTTVTIEISWHTVVVWYIVAPLETIFWHTTFVIISLW